MTDIVKRNMIFSAVCILLLSGVFGIWYYTEQKSEAYRNIYLEFKTAEDEYELGVKIDPVSFIKKTNADDIEFPLIEATTVGEHTYIYIAKDSWGNRKEFVLKLKFADPTKPVLTLTADYVEITEGDSIDFNSFVKEAYDEAEGSLEVEIDAPYELKPGEYEVIYTVSDRHKNKAEAVLKLKVNAKATENSQDISKRDDTRTKKEESGGGSKKENRKENKKDETNNNISSSIPAALPQQKVFLISEYGSIAAAERNAKSYGQNNCPSGHTWYCSPYSDSSGTAAGYIVTFK